MNHHKMNFFHGLLFILFCCCCAQQSLGQDPLHHRRRRTADSNNNLSGAMTVSSHRYPRYYSPRARSRNRYPSSNRYYSPPVKDYSTRIIDKEEFRNNKRSRLWNVNLATRKPGQYSWTSRIVFANAVMYAAQVFFPTVTQFGVKLSDKILRGEQLYRLVTPVFLHGGILHLFTNMLSLQNVGRDVEKLFGQGRFLATYIAAGAAGNYLSALQSPNPALGASGAVFGVIGAYYVFLNQNNWLLGQYGQRMQGAITQTIIMNLFIGAMNPMVDNWGHIGGAIGGAAVAYWFGPRLFLMEIPVDGGGRIRQIVDTPLMRLPRNIESIPERVGKRLRTLPRYTQVDQYKSDVAPKPWRRPTRQQQTPHQRRSTQTRSIKPKDVDEF